MRLILIAYLFSVSVFADVIVLATHNLPPYGSYPEGHDIRKIASDEFAGVAVDRVRCAFKAMEQPLQILVVPWKRAQRMAESGQVDGFFVGSKNNYRDSYAQITDTVAEQKWQWYWLKSNPIKVNDETLKNELRIGAFQGANMARWVESQPYPIYSRPRTTEHLLLQLKNKQIDVLIANNQVMEKLLKSFNMQDKVSTQIVKNKPLGLYISKISLRKNPDLVKNFNKALATCITTL